MSGVKHTPGPWKLDVLPSGGPFGAAGGRAYGVSARGANGLSMPVVVWRGIARPASPEGQANARLIAAAPDLLEALESLVEHTDGIRLPVTAHMMRNRARDTIARARGEQSPSHSDQKEVGNG